jgi:hypothetical protein
MVERRGRPLTASWRPGAARAVRYTTDAGTSLTSQNEQLGEAGIERLGLEEQQEPNWVAIGEGFDRSLSVVVLERDERRPLIDMFSSPVRTASSVEPTGD